MQHVKPYVPHLCAFGRLKSPFSMLKAPARGRWAWMGWVTQAPGAGPTGQTGRWQPRGPVVHCFMVDPYRHALVQIQPQMGVLPAVPRAANRVRAFLCPPPAEGRVHLVYAAAASYKTARCSCAKRGEAKRATPSLQTHTSSILHLPGFPEWSSSELPRSLYPPQMSVPAVVLRHEPTGLGLEPAAVSWTVLGLKGLV